MKRSILTMATILMILILAGCSSKLVQLANVKLDVRNRDVVSLDNLTNTLVLNNKKGDGMAIIEDLSFEKGSITLEIKGENNPGKSFVGLAFNIQNDSTYEAVYFRPFNFKAAEKIRREHSVQYIFHPKYTWRYLRTNNEGQYESEYPRQPSPDDWFAVEIIIDAERVKVYDKKTGTELLSINRLTDQVSDKIGLWTGFNSKGSFRNLRIGK